MTQDDTKMVFVWCLAIEIHV